MTTNHKTNTGRPLERSTHGQLLPDESVESAALALTADPPADDDLRYHMLGDLIVEAIAGEVLPEGGRNGYCDSFEQATLRGLAADLKALILVLELRDTHEQSYTQETLPTVELSSQELRGAISRLALRAAAAAELGARMRRAGRPEAPNGVESEIASGTNGNGHGTAEVQ